MTNFAKKRLLPALVFALLVLLCLPFGAAAAGENQTFWIEREVKVWDEDMEWWDWYTESCAVTVEPIPDRVYSGTEEKPVPVIWLDGEKLTAGVDYDVSYLYNDQIGTAYVCVDFKPPYEGDFEIPFRILSIDASGATVEPIPDQVYNGDEATPVPVVWLDGEKLTAGKDFDVSYSSNDRIGTAYLFIEFIAPYEGYFEIPFRIVPIDASGATIDPIPNQPYDGWEIEPDVTVRLNGVVLDPWYDYDVEWSNNIYPGKATVTVQFEGIYTGRISASFTIVVPPVTGLTASADGTWISLRWNGSSHVSSYVVQRYNASKKKFVKLKTATYPECSDSDLAELTTYRYRVIPVVSANGTQWEGAAAEVSVLSGLKPVQVSVTKLNKKIKLKWKPNSKVDGYLIYRSAQLDPEDFFDTGPVKRIAKITDASTKVYVDKKVKNNLGYTYAVRSFKKVNGKTLISEPEWVDSMSRNAVLSGVKKEVQRSYPVYDTQGKKSKLMFRVNLTDRDIAILDKFAAKHFKDGWTDEQKLEYTLLWINENVTYALGKDWTKIESKTYVEAVFKYKLGQCVQYNGAMAAMMVHLGYPARLIMGFRGSWPDNYWQHFWVESKINGSIYVVECGNMGRSGYWTYFFEPYSYTFGYIKNQKNVS